MKKITLFLHLASSLFFCANLLHAQNVGMGITTPQAPLHIKTAGLEVLRLEGSGTPSLSLYDNGTYRGSLVSRSTNMELYNALPIIISPGFTPSTTFLNNGNVGIGVITPAYRLDVNGDANFTGALRTNGIAGVSGQVLTSNGGAAPTWTNSALTNQIRFSAGIQSPVNVFSGVMGFTVKYNLDPAITINPLSIGFNHTGLYHFDIHAVPNAGGNSAPFFGLTLMTSYSGSYELARPHAVAASGPSSYVENDIYSIDIYLIAGNLLQLPFTLSANAAGYNVEGWLTGYLISD
ncbi:MAG: hypothetical protein ABIX01_00400 [Chitinophagaceae bacterium]